MTREREASKNSKIGIFDSGIGGVSFLKEIQELLPREAYVYYGDLANAPYGTKSQEFIIQRGIAIIDFLLQQDIKALVIACNTATSSAAKVLREHYPNLLILGMEPAIQLGINQKKSKIIVLSTPVTSRAKNTLSLIEKNKERAEIINISCAGLMELIENNQQLPEAENKALIKVYLKEKLVPYLKAGEDLTKITLVLGCTHYIFLKEELKEVLGPVVILDGNRGTAAFLKKLLAEKNLLQTDACLKTAGPPLEIFSSFETLAEKKNFIKKVALFLEK